MLKSRTLPPNKGLKHFLGHTHTPPPTNSRELSSTNPQPHPPVPPKPPLPRKTYPTLLRPGSVSSPSTRSGYKTTSLPRLRLSLAPKPRPWLGRASTTVGIPRSTDNCLPAHPTATPRSTYRSSLADRPPHTPGVRYDTTLKTTVVKTFRTSSICSSSGPPPGAPRGTPPR